MVIRVYEKCWLDTDNDGNKVFGLREYDYISKSNSFEEAVIDLINNFDSDNIIYSNDDFECDCLDSQVIKIEVIEINESY